MACTVRVPSVGSTMDLLHDLAAAGAEAGTVVVAGEQTGGRGSRGREWTSPPGGLWLSVLIRPATDAGVTLLGLRVGLAVADAVESLGPGEPVDIKWPNDLMLGDRKLGGILCEARWQGEALAWIAVGVGINVTNPLPSDLGATATTLAERLPGITPEMVEPEVTARLRAMSPPGERLTPAELSGLRRRDWLAGRRLKGPAAGTASGISEEGALLVRSDGGRMVGVRAGTVELADRARVP